MKFEIKLKSNQMKLSKLSIFSIAFDGSRNGRSKPIVNAFQLKSFTWIQNLGMRKSRLNSLEVLKYKALA